MTNIEKEIDNMKFKDRKYKEKLDHRRTITIINADGSDGEIFEADITIEKDNILDMGTSVSAKMFNDWDFKIDKLTSDVDTVDANKEGIANVAIVDGKIKFSNLKGATGLGADPRYEFELTVKNIQNTGSPPYLLALPIPIEILESTADIQLIPKDIVTKKFMDKYITTGWCQLIDNQVVIKINSKDFKTLSLLAIAYRKEIL